MKRIINVTISDPALRTAQSSLVDVSWSGEAQKVSPIHQSSLTHFEFCRLRNLSIQPSVDCLPDGLLQFFNGLQKSIGRPSSIRRSGYGVTSLIQRLLHLGRVGAEWIDVLDLDVRIGGGNRIVADEIEDASPLARDVSQAAPGRVENLRNGKCPTRR